MKIYAKKLVSLLLAMAVLSSMLLFSTAVFADEVTYLDEDFSNFVNTGAAHKAAGVVAVQSGADVFQAGANDKALKVSVGGEPISIMYSTPVNSGYAVLNYSVYHTTVASGTFHVGFAMAHNTVGFRYSFWKTSGSNFSVTDYSAGENHASAAALKGYAQPIKANKWYQHSFIVDPANGKMYAYLDGQLLNPEGFNCYDNADVQQVCGFSIENDGNLRYFDDLYIDQFSTMEAAEEAIRVKSILAGEKTNSYSAAALAAYKTSANAQLAALRANGSDAAALAALKTLGDSMIPTVKHVVYEENFEQQTVGSVPVSNHEYIWFDVKDTVAVAQDSGSADTYATLPGTASQKVHFRGFAADSKLILGNIHPLGNNLTWEARVRWNEMPTANYEDFLQGMDFNWKKFWTTQVLADGRVNLYNYNYNADGTYFPTATTIIPSLQVGKWYDLRFEYNHASKLVEAYVDGVYAGAGHTIPDSVIYTENVNFVKGVFDFLNVRSNVSVDNLRFSTSHGVPQNTIIQGSTYTDENGAPVAKLTAGGKVASTYVTKNLNKDYVLYTAAYVDDVLTGPVKVSSLDEVPVGVPTAVTVDLDVPAGGEVRQFVWRSDMRPVMTDVAHYAAPKSGAKLHIIGDSTVATYAPEDYYPEQGWGGALSKYLSDDIEINNFATPGFTLKAFYENTNLWKTLLSQMNAGDYLMIQFGHNDMKSAAAEYADVHNNYRAYLNLFIQEAQQKGVMPILVTAPQRQNMSGCDMHGNYVWAGTAGLVSYADAAKAVGRALNVPVIDLNSSFTALLDNAGGATSEEALKIFLFLNANDARYFGESGIYNSSTYNKASRTLDGTHFTVYGAEVLAKLIATELSRADISLSGAIDLTYEPVAPAAYVAQ